MHRDVISAQVRFRRVVLQFERDHQRFCAKESNQLENLASSSTCERSREIGRCCSAVVDLQRVWHNTWRCDAVACKRFESDIARITCRPPNWMNGDWQRSHEEAPATLQRFGAQRTQLEWPANGMCQPSAHCIEPRVTQAAAQRTHCLADGVALRIGEATCSKTFKKKQSSMRTSRAVAAVAQNKAARSRRNRRCKLTAAAALTTDSRFCLSSL